MATIASWNGHTFTVSPSLIRGYTGFTMKGSCETTTKNSEKQKYETRKYGESPTFSMTIGLNALTGVTDVFGEAMAWIREATQGACAYFYMGTKKLIPAKAILVSAEISEVVNAPAKGDTWVSCDVKVTFKQGTKTDSGAGGGNGGGGGGSNKVSVKSTGVKGGGSTGENKSVGQIAAKIVSAAKRACQLKQVGLAAQKSKIAKAIAVANSATKIGATTSRNCEITTAKITRVPGAVKLGSVLR